MADDERGEGVELKGKLQTFGFGSKKRRWITLNRSFCQIKKFMTVDEYSIAKGSGEQRGRIQQWCNHLGKRMIADDFTPASWSAGIRESHLSHLKLDGSDVTLFVPKDNPIPCLDGNQRWGAMESVYRGSDTSLKRAIDSCSITVQIYLDPDEIKKDFRRLQLGRPVDKSHLLALEISDESNPLLLFMRDVALRLNLHAESHLLNQIKFDSSEKAPLGFATITTKSASELSTSLRAGAIIALHDNYQRDMEWAIRMYVAAYQAIVRYGSTEDVDEGDGMRPHPRLLLKGRVLRPTLLRGGKGGSSLLIGLGNALIFRMAHLGKDEPSVKDLKYLVECAEDVFMEDVNGNMSGSTKRMWMGMFGRRYFRDIVNLDGEMPSEHKLSARSGIPTILCELTSQSSWGVQKNWKNGQLSVNGADEESEEEALPEPEDEPEVNSRVIDPDTDEFFFDAEQAEKVEQNSVVDEELKEDDKPKAKGKRGRNPKPVMG